MNMRAHCESPYARRRRRTRAVVVGDPQRGGVIIGAEHPAVMQSMITCDTMDTAECVKQTLELVAVGCQIVRITAPTVKAPTEVLVQLSVADPSGAVSTATVKVMVNPAAAQGCGCAAGSGADALGALLALAALFARRRVRA